MYVCVFSPFFDGDAMHDDGVGDFHLLFDSGGVSDGWPLYGRLIGDLTQRSNDAVWSHLDTHTDTHTEAWWVCPFIVNTEQVGTEIDINVALTDGSPDISLKWQRMDALLAPQTALGPGNKAKNNEHSFNRIHNVIISTETVHNWHALQTWHA